MISSRLFKSSVGDMAFPNDDSCMKPLKGMSGKRKQTKRFVARVGASGGAPTNYSLKMAKIAPEALICPTRTVKFFVVAWSGSQRDCKP